MIFKDSPFDYYFKDFEHVLQYPQSGKCPVLRVKFSVECGLYLYVFDDERMSRITHSCNADTVEEMDTFFASIEQEFQTLIPAMIYARAKEFLTLLPDAFMLDIDLNNGSGYDLCKVCGDYDQNNFQGAYFPGFGVHTDAIEVSYGFDCHPISKKYAVSVNDEDMDGVWQILNYLIDTATYGDNHEAIQDFRTRLQEIVQTSKAGI